jgi:alpha-glucosidase
MKDYGYDVSDYCAIDPLFGDLQDFDDLVTGLHDLGLKLVIDQVYSHTSDQHPWFTESRGDRSNAKADWYVFADPKPDGGPPNNWLAAFGGGSWTFEPRRRQYYLHNFLPSQPDLDLSRPQVQDAILGVAQFWFDRGVDGFRLDVANCYTCDPTLADNPPSGLRSAARPTMMQKHVNDRDQAATLAFAGRLRRLADERPGRFLLAELASDDPEGAMAFYASGPERFHTAYAFRFLSKPFSADIIRKGVETLLERGPDVWPSWAFSNHDFERVASRWGDGRPSPRIEKTLIALLTSLRGSAFLYQGEELGLPQADVPFEALRDPDGIASWPAYKGRDGCRTPMPWEAKAPFGGFSANAPWLPLAEPHRALAVDVQEADAQSVLAFTRAWLAWRKERRALKDGDIAFLDLPEPLLGFERWAGREGVRLIFNLGGEALETPAGAHVAVGFALGGEVRDGLVRLPPGAGILLLLA